MLSFICGFNSYSAVYSTWAGLTSSTFGAVGCGVPGLPNGHWFNGVAGCCFPTGPTTHSLLINATHTRNYQTGDGALNTSGSLTVAGNWNCSINGTVGSVIVQNGGILTITAGTFTVTGTITVDAGGTLNVNGGTIVVQGSGNSLVINGTVNIGAGTLARNAGKMFINTGGLVKITASGGKLDWTGGTNYSQIEGTFDCQSILTSGTCTNYELGEVCVPSNSSIGRIKTSNAYTPSASTNISASNNFFGFNDEYGGTVEYYGGSAITLDATWSRYNFYDLEVNNTAGVTLSYSGCMSISGNLYLKAGKLVLNKKQINIHGTIVYTGSNYIDPGTGGGKVYFQGKITSSVSPCVNFFSSITTDIPAVGGTSIYSQGSTVNIKNPVLKLSAAGGATVKLEQFKVFRSDIITMNDNITIEDDAGTAADPLLSVKVGIIKTGSYTLFFNNVSQTWLEHWTVGYSAPSTVGWISGNLKRRCAIGYRYEFPVGIQNVTDFATDYMKYRQIDIENTTMSATTNFKVNFNQTFVPDVCSGTLVNAYDFDIYYTQLHPQGWWSVDPDVDPTGLDYNVYAYIHGFTDIALVDNRFGLLKRQDGGTTCDQWTNGGGSLNALGTSGRIHEYSSSLEIGYAQRNDLTSYSEFAIGLTDEDILPIVLLNFNAILNSDNEVEVDWITSSETNNDYFTIERSNDGIEYTGIANIKGAGTSNTNLQYSYSDQNPFSGTSYYRLKQTDFDGKSETFAPVAVTIKKQEEFTYTIYPNPASKVLNLVYENANENTSFEISDLLGNKICSQTLEKSNQSKKITLNVSDYEKGIYFIKVTSSGIISVKKIVIQ
ncbi:MAG: T9SS type A sorting domain-containing protein [Bacteroidota bacterium]